MDEKGIQSWFLVAGCTLVEAAYEAREQSASSPQVRATFSRPYQVIRARPRVRPLGGVLLPAHASMSSRSRRCIERRFQGSLAVSDCVPAAASRGNPMRPRPGELPRVCLSLGGESRG